VERRLQGQGKGGELGGGRAFNMNKGNIERFSINQSCAVAMADRSARQCSVQRAVQADRSVCRMGGNQVPLCRGAGRGGLCLRPAGAGGGQALWRREYGGGARIARNPRSGHSRRAECIRIIMKSVSSNSQVRVSSVEVVGCPYSECRLY
jgi:hypothetical protein